MFWIFKKLSVTDAGFYGKLQNFQSFSHHQIVAVPVTFWQTQRTYHEKTEYCSFLKRPQNTIHRKIQSIDNDDHHSIPIAATTASTAQQPWLPPSNRPEYQPVSMSNGTRLHHFKVKIAVEPVIGHCSEISSYHTLFLIIITGGAIGPYCWLCKVLLQINYIVLSR